MLPPPLAAVHTWDTWRRVLPLPVQVLLDHAVKQYQACPEDPAYAWVRPTVEHGIPPWTPWIAGFCPLWESLLETEGRLHPIPIEDRCIEFAGQRIYLGTRQLVTGPQAAVAYCNALSFAQGEIPTYWVSPQQENALFTLPTGFRLPSALRGITLLGCLHDTQTQPDRVWLTHGEDLSDEPGSLLETPFWRIHPTLSPDGWSIRRYSPFTSPDTLWVLPLLQEQI